MTTANFISVFILISYSVSTICQSTTTNELSLMEILNQPQLDNVGNHTSVIIIGNQYTEKAEVYQLTFTCGSDYCLPLPLESHDLLWSSPDTPYISEVKYVEYNGQPAILCTTQQGAIIYAYPSGSVLFHRELDVDTNVHSAEVLPDGNVVIAGSQTYGIIFILYPDGSNLNQRLANTVTMRINSVSYCHGVVYDKTRSVLYAGCYLKFVALNYTTGPDGRGTLDTVAEIALEEFYDEANKNEDAMHEDGIHDLYPVDNSTVLLFMSTGEHVYTINVEDFTVSYFTNFYYITSKKSRDRTVAVPDKGGVKAISADAKNGLVVAKSSPWFKEWYVGTTDDNYNVYQPVLLWTMPKTESPAGYCPYPNFDFNEQCKINFDDVQPILFYKARIFHRPVFSY